MTYYEEYIRQKAEETFDLSKAKFTLYDGNSDEVEGALDPSLNEQLFIGVMREMVAYLYEKGRNADVPNVSMDMIWDADNVDKIYISSHGIQAPVVIVEYKELPPWFKMENADLREFYYHPNPAMSGTWSGAYFQAR
jgi:hypothetical protein